MVSMHDTQRSRVFFDAGHPLWFNLKSLPPNGVQFLPPANDAVVILSHWDYDHYSRGIFDPSLRRLVWIAPDDRAGPNAKKFADSLGPRLFVLPAGHSMSVGHIKVTRANGADRNNSGIVARIRAGKNGFF